MSTLHPASILCALCLLFPSKFVFAVEDQVILGSFSSQASAEQHAKSLAKKVPYSIDVKLYGGPSGNLYRLTIGPLSTPKSKQVITQLADLGVDSWRLRINEPDSVPATIAQDNKDTTNEVANLPEYSGIKELESSKTGKRLSLIEAVHMALERNLRLQAGQTQLHVASGRSDQARSALLPQLGLSAGQTAIDKDRASASNGRAPEYQSFASLSLQQLIYSDDVSAAYQIQKILVEAAGHEYQMQLQDVVLETSVAYLTVLRSESLLSVITDDLKLTESNLEQANVRLSYGVTSKSEVYRWQSRLSVSRSAVTNAISVVENSYVNLNHILNQPLMQKGQLENPSLGDETFLLNQAGLLDSLKDPVNRLAGFEFWQRIALEHAPELALAQSKQAVTERSLTASKRSLYVPTVKLSGEIRKNLDESGEGVDELDFTFPGFETQIGGSTDDVDWNASLVAQLPLYSGGERLARIRTSGAEFNEAQLLVDETQLSVRAQLLKQYNFMMASLLNIDNARVAAESSKKNLELVLESYNGGVVTIIDLLDAQLVALTSALDKANAEYDFLIEYYRLQRASGRFDLLMTKGDRGQVRSQLALQLRGK
jgi:outer membrane protein